MLLRHSSPNLMYVVLAFEADYSEEPRYSCSIAMVRLLSLDTALKPAECLIDPELKIRRN
jgi:hypothetical protein